MVLAMYVLPITQPYTHGERYVNYSLKNNMLTLTVGGMAQEIFVYFLIHVMNVANLELSDSGDQSIIMIVINNRDLDSILLCYQDYLSISVLSQKYG